MTKKNFLFLLLLIVIIGGAIGGAIVFLAQAPPHTLISTPAISMAEPYIWIQ